ncbi:MAG: NAD-dependent epimerase/dehydratase family protein [Candidatus Nanoarchaeia archaeon]
MKIQKSYIVTGGAGFIGSHVVEELVKRGEKIKVIDNLLTGKKENIAQFMDKITFVEGSITDSALLEKEFKGADVIIHLAALPSVPKSLKNPALSDINNINGTVNVFETSRKLGLKVVFASSSSVYGNSGLLPNKEVHPPGPESFYALQKYTDERYAAIFHKLYSSDFVGLRFFNVFGPRQDPFSEYAAVIPKFIRLMKNNEVPTIYGDGEVSRDFTYVKNVVHGILLACEAKNTGGKIYNVAAGGTISLNKLFQLINENLGKNFEANHGPASPGEVKHSQADITKAGEELGYKVLYSFEEGLAETINSIK